MSLLVVDKEKILTNLNKLNELYNNSISDDLTPIFYSKLALMEYCGWIECSIDILMMRVTENEYESIISSTGKSFLNNINNFSYKDHFIKILVQVLGMINAEKVVKHFKETGELDVLKSKLDNTQLRQSRNIAAHTYHRDDSVRYDAPNIFITDVNTLFDIFVKIASYIDSLTSETSLGESTENLLV